MAEKNRLTNLEIAHDIEMVAEKDQIGLRQDMTTNLGGIKLRPPYASARRRRQNVWQSVERFTCLGSSLITDGDVETNVTLN